MQTKQRRNERDPRGQLLTLLNGWDPAGRLNAGKPRDEYDFMVDQLLDLLSTAPTEAEVAAFLERHVSEHFGLAPRDSKRFAAKAVTWYRMLAAAKE